MSKIDNNWSDEAQLCTGNSSKYMVQYVTNAARVGGYMYKYIFVSTNHDQNLTNNSNIY